LALVDADNKFLWVDVWANGSTSDCAIYNQSQLKDELENWTIVLPPPRPLPGHDTPIQHFVMGLAAFPRV